MFFFPSNPDDWDLNNWNSTVLFYLTAQPIFTPRLSQGMIFVLNTSYSKFHRSVVEFCYLVIKPLVAFLLMGRH